MYSSTTGGGLSFLNIAATSKMNSLGNTMFSDLGNPSAILFNPANSWSSSKYKISFNNVNFNQSLDVFLLDFQPPPVEKWNLNLVKNFIEKWFVENANPMEEDIESMRESLLSLFQFLAEEKLLPETLLDPAKKYLQNE